MATIKLQRSKEYVNRFRSYRIYIDGKNAGKVKDGETVNFEVASGHHTIVAKVDWCSSPVISVTLTDSEERKLSVAGFKNASWILLVGVVIAPLYFLLPAAKQDKYLYFILPVLIPFFVLMYYISAGRKKYLRLEEKIAHREFADPKYATN